MDRSRRLPDSDQADGIPKRLTRGTIFPSTLVTQLHERDVISMISRLRFYYASVYVEGNLHQERKHNSKVRDAL